MEKKTDKRGRTIIEEIPYQGIRKVIGQRMLQSLTTVPQGSIMVRADMTKIVAFREKLKADGVKVSYTDIFAKLIACAVQEVPIINSTRDDKNITVLESVNVGIAVKASSDLVVPVISNVQSKSLKEIADESRTIIENAREKKYHLIPMDGGTITLNNLGMFNVEACTPVLNPPEAAILAVGSIRKEAWVDKNDNITVRPVTTLSLTIDHAIMDGGPAGEFIGAIKKMMDAPEQYLL